MVWCVLRRASSAGRMELGKGRNGSSLVASSRAALTTLTWAAGDWVTEVPFDLSCH